MRDWLKRRQAQCDQAEVASAVGRDIFDSIESAELVSGPYPHLVVENALPAKLADALLTGMPVLEVFTRGKPPGSNLRFALPSRIALADSRVSEPWKAALRQCNAALPSLLGHFVRRFRGDLLKTFPDFASRFAPPENLRPVPRAKWWRRRDEIGMDAQMVINSPALAGGSSVRGPHLDVADKLISGLLYLRSPHDDSTSGELQLYAPNTDRVRFDGSSAAFAGHVRPVRTYPYRHNLLILPLATPMAVHGVSPRGATAHPRYHLHIVGQLSSPLFQISR
jgi:hypothetical protein